MGKSRRPTAFPRSSVVDNVVSAPTCRRFVEKELFVNFDQMPEKHNLSFYPTVNDLQNNIHQALQDIENGILPVTAQMVSNSNSSLLFNCTGIYNIYIHT